jgi:hypothetical protein
MGPLVTSVKLKAKDGFLTAVRLLFQILPPGKKRKQPNVANFSKLYYYTSLKYPIWSDDDVDTTLKIRPSAMLLLVDKIKIYEIGVLSFA